jgi:CBS domain-containing protein
MAADTIEQVMTPNPLIYSAETSVFDAARAMRDNEVGDVLVEQDGELCGLVTDRDIVVRVLAEPLDPGSTPIGHICSSELATVDAAAPIDEAVGIMRERALRRLPVVRNGRPVGIVSLGDLAIDADPRSALAEISSAPPNR